jgi:hypothetical protein
MPSRKVGVFGRWILCHSVAEERGALGSGASVGRERLKVAGNLVIAADEW